MLLGEGRRGSRTERNSHLRGASCNIDHDIPSRNVNLHELVHAAVFRRVESHRERIASRWPVSTTKPTQKLPWFAHSSRTRARGAQHPWAPLQSPGAGWVIFVYFSCFFQVFREFIRFFPGLFAFSARTTPAHPIQC